MADTKNLCAQIPVSLHNRVREEQAKAEKSLSEYVTQILTEYYEGGHINMVNVRTLAIQVPEELFQKLKRYLDEESARRGVKLTQKEFILSLIEQALENH